METTGEEIRAWIGRALQHHVDEMHSAPFEEVYEGRMFTGPLQVYGRRALIRNCLFVPLRTAK